MKTAKFSLLKRDRVITIYKGRDLVGISFDPEDGEALKECSPKKADLIVATWNMVAGIQRHVKHERIVMAYERDGKMWIALRCKTCKRTLYKFDTKQRYHSILSRD